MYIDKYKIADGGYRDEKKGVYCNSAIDFIQKGILGHCTCGLVKESLEYLRLILCEIDKKGSIDVYETDPDLFHSDGERFTIYFMLDNYGLTDHGGCVPGWLTVKGKRLLDDLSELNENGDLR